MRRAVILLIGILILTLQVTVVNFIGFNRLSPDFLLIYIIFIALYSDRLSACILASLLGLFYDLTVGAIFGVTGLIYFTVAFTVSKFRRIIYRDSSLIIAMITLTATIVSLLISMLTMVPVFRAYPFVAALIKGVFVLPILNTVIALIIYRPISERLGYMIEENGD